MKWFLVALVLALVVLFVQHERSSIKSSYVNGLPQYSALPNHEYLFEQDCYIFKIADHDTDWPLVGSHLTVPGLPTEVAEKYIGTTVNGIRLLDIVHPGAGFKLVSVRRDEGRQGTSITFEVLFDEEALRKYPRLDVYYMLDHTPESEGRPPTFLPRYAVPQPTI